MNPHLIADMGGPMLLVLALPALGAVLACVGLVYGGLWLVRRGRAEKPNE